MVEIRLNAFQTHWIVLPPSLIADAWRATLRERAARAGFSVCDLQADQDVPDGHDIVLTDDLGGAVAAGVSQDSLTVIALPPFIDLEGCSTNGEVHARVDTVSRRIADAFSFPGHVVHDLGGEISVGRLPPFRGTEVRILQPRPITSREAALQQAVSVFTNGEGHWSPGLFTYDERNLEAGPQSGRLDVMGRPRFLVTGPYMSMPVGTWEAKVSLSFDHDVSSRRFRIDWGGIETFTSYEFCPGRSGVFDITLDFSWGVSSPAELRLLVLEGVFHGGVVFGGAVVRRVGEPSGA